MGDTKNINFGTQSSLLASACLSKLNSNELDENALSEALQMILQCVDPDAAKADVVRILKNLTAAYRRLREGQQSEKARLREAVHSLFTSHNWLQENDMVWFNDFIGLIAIEFESSQELANFTIADYLSRMFAHYDAVCDEQFKKSSTPKFLRKVSAKTCSLLRAKLTVAHRRTLLRLACTLSTSYSISNLVARATARSNDNMVEYDFSGLHLVTRLVSIELTIIADECTSRLQRPAENLEPKSTSVADKAGDFEESLGLLSLGFKYFEKLLDFLVDESSARAAALRADDSILAHLRKVLTETLEMVQTFQNELLNLLDKSHSDNERKDLLHLLIASNCRLISRWWTAETDLEPEAASVVNENKKLLVRMLQYAREAVKISSSSASAIVNTNNESNSNLVQLQSLMSGMLALLSNAYLNDDLRETLFENSTHVLLIEYFRLCKSNSISSSGIESESESGGKWLAKSFGDDRRNDANDANLCSLAAVLHVFVTLSSVALSSLISNCRNDIACYEFVVFARDLMLDVASPTFPTGAKKVELDLLRLRMLSVAVLCAVNHDFSARLISNSDQAAADGGIEKSSCNPKVCDKQSFTNISTDVLLNAIKSAYSTSIDEVRDSDCELYTLIISALCTFLEREAQAHSSKTRRNDTYDVWRSLMHSPVLERLLHELSISVLHSKSVTNRSHQIADKTASATASTEIDDCMAKELECLRLRLLGALQRCWNDVHNATR